jgi:DNA-binding PadR family transcriptional regulator
MIVDFCYYILAALTRPRNRRSLKIEIECLECFLKSDFIFDYASMQTVVSKLEADRLIRSLRHSRNSDPLYILTSSGKNILRAENEKRRQLANYTDGALRSYERSRRKAVCRSSKNVVRLQIKLPERIE